MVNDKIYVRVEILGRDKQLFESVKRLAVLTGGHPFCLIPKIQEKEFENSGESIFVFGSETKAKDFKYSLTGRFNGANAEIIEIPFDYLSVENE